MWQLARAKGFMPLLNTCGGISLALSDLTTHYRTYIMSQLGSPETASVSSGWLSRCLAFLRLSLQSLSGRLISRISPKKNISHSLYRGRVCFTFCLCLQQYYSINNFYWSHWFTSREQRHFINIDGRNICFDHRASIAYGLSKELTLQVFP